MNETTASEFSAVFEAIRQDGQNADFTARGIDPLYTAGPRARVVIVGQAPGRIAQETRIPWNDRSGERLRDWLGMDRATFYDPNRVAIIPMDFYFPGSGRGGDLPPRPGFAEKWHPVLLGMMPEVRLVVLVGSYAVRHYLGLSSSTKLTDVVRGYRDVLDKGIAYRSLRMSGQRPSGQRMCDQRASDSCASDLSTNNPCMKDQRISDPRASDAAISAPLASAQRGPRLFPLVHPSPRNQMWLKRNPWFEAEVLPDLRREVRRALER